MQTSMRRSRYDIAARRLLEEFLLPVAAEEMLRQQYPKSRDEATRELHFRGVRSTLPDREAFTAEELDEAVAAAEQLGMLTSEAQRAKAAGVTLADWRGQHGAEPQAFDADRLDLAGIWHPFVG